VKAWNSGDGVVFGTLQSLKIKRRRPDVATAAASFREGTSTCAAWWSLHLGDGAMAQRGIR
jgi:hypothetical protein